MTGHTLPLDDRWKNVLHVQHRLPPDFFEDSNEVRGTPYAPAIRVGLQELRLSAIFCVNGVPTVAIRRSEHYVPETIRGIRSALWNQGLASILVDIAESTKTVRIFSLAGIRIPIGIGQPDAHGLIESIDATTAEVDRLCTYITGAESGRIWQEHAPLFRPEERIDAVMLKNLAVSHKRLTGLGLTPAQAQAILTQTIFIAYLEDRDIIDRAYFERITKERYTTWEAILEAGDINAVAHLSQQLKSDFGGDMFVSTSSYGETTEDAHLTSDHLQLLMRFRIGNELMTHTGKNQALLWRYDFRYIPVDLICSVYDQFLHSKNASASKTGMYYTPARLADTAISSMWSQLSDEQKAKGTFLDPACGSGIFLVKTFQRLCQHKTETDASGPAMLWDDSLNVLSRVRGLNDDPATVRIAVFSLYLALLEQISSSHSIQVSESRHRLPKIWGKIIASGNFFEESYKEHQVDVIVGNLLSSGRRVGDSRASRWIESNKRPFPRKEIAWAFTWKALEHLPDGGVLAFILPSKTFLHSQERPSIRARSELIRYSTVKQVIELSDLRRMLFLHSTQSFALIVTIKQVPCTDPLYNFEYLTPKADPHFANGRFISVNSDDSKWIQSNEIDRDSLVFRHRLDMRASETSLFQYLSHLPTLDGRKGKFFQTLTPYGQPPIGLRFRPVAATNADHRGEAAQMFGRLRLCASEFTPVRISQSTPTPIGIDDTLRVGPENGNCGARILVPRIIRSGTLRIRAAYVDHPIMTVRDIMAINVPRGAESRAKMITAILNSRLLGWFAFHGTKIFQADKHVVGWRDLARLPAPLPSDLSELSTAHQVFDELVRQVDEFVAPSPNEEGSEGSVNEVLKEIDRLTYAYFGLSEDEIALVEEIIKYVMPATRPLPKAYPSIWQPSNYADRRAYSSTLRQHLSGWFVGDPDPNVRMYARNDDYAILKISITTDRTDPYTESDCRPFPSALAELGQAVGDPLSINFCAQLDVQLFVGENLYLVKPLQKRYWLHSAAISDVGSIAAELESLWQHSRIGSVAS